MYNIIFIYIFDLYIFLYYIIFYIFLYYWGIENNL